MNKFNNKRFLHGWGMPMFNQLQSSWSRKLVCVLAVATAWLLPSSFQFDQSSSSAQETIPEGLTVVSIEAIPEQITLVHPFDYRQILITGTLDNGQSVDLTRAAELTNAESQNNVVSLDEQRLVSPIVDGTTTLDFSFQGQQVQIPVSVSGVNDPYDPGFVHDVQPVLSRMGCNAGTCHGSKDGKNGFKLSLRGYDGVYDYRALTDDIAARRFNRAAPDQSLMLLKATGAIPHVGGGLTRPGDRYYELLRRWISNGVPYDGDSAPRVESIAIVPDNPILPQAGLRQQIVVMATYTDGAVRDVTKEAFIESGNIEVIEAEEGGIVRMLRRGEAPVLVRYEGAYAATTLTVMGDRSGFAWNNPETFNYVDEHVYDKLQTVKVLPSNLCTDAEFVRRIYLDLTGLPPSAEVVSSFVADERPTREKRSELIDELIGNPEYIEHWTNKWADLLQVNRKFLGEQGAISLRNWIKESISENKPYDQFAHELITASGSTLENPAASYYKVLREPDMIMENTTHLFLAVRFNCNKCHDHPFERWTQDQYYELAAYFGQVRLKEDPLFNGQRIGGSAVEGAKPLVEIVFDAQRGEVTHDRTGEQVAPAFPYVHAETVDTSMPRRQQLAQWLTSPENQYFARSTVNRLWGYMFGVGIIEPIDDIRAGNPPTNPALLDALEAEFIASGFDLQHIIRTICNSRTYQHSYITNRWNEDDQINYSHAIPRRLPAEVLFDTIHEATGAPFSIPGAPVGFRAAELPDAGVRLAFLDDFGKPPRESACECERSSGMVLGPIMKLVNGPTISNALHHPDNAIAKLVAENDDDREVIEQMFLRFLARYPTLQEVDLALSAIELAGEDHAINVEALETYLANVPDLQAQWEARLNRTVQWETLTLGEFASQVGAEFQSVEDQSVKVSGNNGKDVYSFSTEWMGATLTGFRLEAMQDEGLPAGGPGRAQNGNFVLSELTITAVSKADPTQSRKLTLANAVADFSQSGWAVQGAIDGNPGSGWAVSPQFNQTHTALFQVTDGELYEGGTILKFEMSQQYQDSTHSLGRFRFSATTSPPPIGFGALAEPLATAIRTPVEERTEEQKQFLRDEYLKSDATYAALQARVAQSQRELDNPRLSGMQDLGWALINNAAFLFNR